MELPTKGVKEGVSCCALLSLESLLKKLKRQSIQGMTCAFTGHRPQSLPFGFDESDKRCTSLKSVMRDQIVALIENEGVTHFITGMALGVDMYAAEIVLDLKSKYPHITLESAIPCETQAIKWSVASRERYYNIAAKCRQGDHAATGVHVGLHGQEKSVHGRITPIIFSQYGMDAPAVPGTPVRYAHKKGKSIIVINPVSLDVTRE